MPIFSVGMKLTTLIYQLVPFCFYWRMDILSAQSSGVKQSFKNQFCLNLTARKLTSTEVKVLQSTRAALRELKLRSGSLQESELCNGIRTLVNQQLSLMMPKRESDSLRLPGISEEQTKKEEDNETDSTDTSSSVEKGKPVAIFPTKPFPKPLVDEEASFLPPFLSVIILLARSVVLFRAENCHQRGGQYNTALGICVLGTGSTVDNIIDQLSVVGRRTRDHLTLAGNVCSLVALSAVLFVYVRLPELRNVPGNNIICLSLSFSAMHVLQTLAIYVGHYNSVCRVSGILLHLAYLSSFAWMAVISFDLCRTFLYVRAREEIQSRSFYRYAVFGFVVPSFIVVIYVIVDAHTARGIGYGVDRYCFIVRFWPSLSFVGCVFLVLLFNIFCLTLTLKSIYQNHRATQRVLSRVKKKTKSTALLLLLMVCKLSTIAGLGWIFGVIGAATRNRGLTYLYLILVNFQGVFLFLAFVCNRRVYRLCFIQKPRHNIPTKKNFTKSPDLNESNVKRGHSTDSIDTVTTRL